MQADAIDVVARDCEVVNRPAPPAPPPTPAPPPPSGPPVVELSVCPSSAATIVADQYTCGSNSAGGSISGASTIYCSAKITNGVGKTASVAFVFGGSEFFEPPGHIIDATTWIEWAFTSYAPATFPPGSWGCRAKLDGVVVAELSFTT